MSADAIVEFLDTFRQLQAVAEKSKLISLKVPETLLRGFRQKCELNGVRYQTQIKQLMLEWVQSAANCPSPNGVRKSGKR